MHKAYPNNKHVIMNKLFANFPLCGGCSRRERREGLENGKYYCVIAETILPEGNFTIHTEATNFVRNCWLESQLRCTGRCILPTCCLHLQWPT